MGQTLKGRTAIVTGAGSGIGRAVARRFVEEGARVMLSCADEKGLAETLKEVGGHADQVAHFACDLEERLSVTNLLSAQQDAFGHLDILVDAARQSAPGTCLDIGADDFDAAWRDNVQSVFMLAQATAKRMIAQGEKDPKFRGAMVNITSIAARRTVPELFAHSVTCAALDQMTRSMASCLAEHRIRVNAVALGSVMTGTLRVALKERAELREEMVRVTPLGRIGEADEAASAALYLASDQSSFVTGQVLAVDGGRTVLDPLASPVR
jgi:7-alpha-hydroxysteroid dehydrogenase